MPAPRDTSQDGMKKGASWVCAGSHGHTWAGSGRRGQHAGLGERGGALHTLTGGLSAGTGTPRLLGDPSGERTGTRRQACPALSLQGALGLLCPQAAPSDRPGLFYGMTMK